MLSYFFFKTLKFLRLISKDKFKQKTSEYTKLYKLVYRSNLFDEKWYLNNYPELKKSKLSAINHYIHHGVMANYMPSKNFDAKQVFSSLKPLYYGLYERKDRKSFLIEHRLKNKIENFSFSKRKILLFSHELSLSGAPRALLNLAISLREIGLEPIFISPSFGELEKELLNSDFEYYVEPLLMMKLVFQDSEIQRFFSAFDCIVFNSLASIEYAQFIKAKNKKIAWIHEAYYGFHEQVNENLKRAYENIDEVYSVSPYSKSFTDFYLGEKNSKVLPLYIDEKVLPKKIAVEKILSFILIGPSTEVKGHDIFLDAISKLSEEIKSNCTFKIVGKLGKDTFSKRVIEVAKKEKVVCTGALNYNETLIELNQADIVVCPSRDESLSMVCIEGMMFEKVILCSNTTGISKYLRHKKNAYLFELSVENLKNSIEELYSNQQSLSELALAARKVYEENFTKEVFDNNIRKIFLD